MNLKPFRSSLREKLKAQKLTLSSLATLSDLSEDTLRSIIYGKSQDIKLSTLLKLADVLHCSIDELINRNTYSFEIRKLFDRMLILPKSSIRVIKMIITIEEKCMLQKSMSGKELIPILIPKGNMQDGMYYDGLLYDTLDISNYPVNLIKETSFGLKIQNDYFEPYYYQNDILLLSIKNTPKNSDIILYVNNTGKLFIRKLTNLGLEPIGKFGEIIPVKELRNYSALGVIIKSVKEANVEQYR